jgi:membrane-associated phospholipid phosphatase
VEQEHRRRIIAFWSVAAACLVVAAAGILVLDRPIAEWAASQPRGDTIWATGVRWLDLVTLRATSNSLLGPILMIAGGVLLLLSSTRRTGWHFLFVGAVQFASTMVANLAREQIGRLGPSDAMANPGAADVWLGGGAAFPAGSAAFYAGLFLPLMLIVPRWTFLLALLPLLLGAAEMIGNRHYLSDIAAGFSIAALMTGAFSFLLKKADY